MILDSDAFPFGAVGNISQFDPGSFQFIADLVGESKILRFLRITTGIDFCLYFGIRDAVFRNDGEFTGCDSLFFQLFPFCGGFFQQAEREYAIKITDAEEFGSVICLGLQNIIKGCDSE